MDCLGGGCRMHCAKRNQHLFPEKDVLINLNQCLQVFCRCFLMSIQHFWYVYSRYMGIVVWICLSLYLSISKTVSGRRDCNLANFATRVLLLKIPPYHISPSIYVLIGTFQSQPRFLFHDVKSVKPSGFQCSWDCSRIQSVHDRTFWDWAGNLLGLSDPDVFFPKFLQFIPALDSSLFPLSIRAEFQPQKWTSLRRDSKISPTPGEDHPARFSTWKKNDL